MVAKSSTVLVLDDRGWRHVAPSALVRTLIRWRAPSLDRRLAAGAARESTLSLAVRATQLAHPHARAALARDWLSLAARASASGRAATRVPFARPAVRDAATLIAELAAALTRPGPLPARGVAAARRLLTDGAGPVYRRGRRLPTALREVLDLLTSTAPAARVR